MNPFSSLKTRPSHVEFLGDSPERRFGKIIYRKLSTWELSRESPSERGTSCIDNMPSTTVAKMELDVGKETTKETTKKGNGCSITVAVAAAIAAIVVVRARAENTHTLPRF